jgi:Uma2 family endonuclease
MGIWPGEVPGELVLIPLGRPATVDDLHRTKLKAEIVGGELIAIGPFGHRPGRAAGNISLSLFRHQQRHDGGYAMGARVAFIVDLPNRLSFCPDASWWVGDPEVHYFPHGAPVFAVEVRELGEYSDEAEQRMAAKRADYFAAGTQVVWDVDALREELSASTARTIRSIPWYTAVAKSRMPSPRYRAGGLPSTTCSAQGSSKIGKHPDPPVYDRQSPQQNGTGSPEKRVHPFRFACLPCTLTTRVKGRRQMTPHANPTGASMNIAPLGREATLEDLLDYEDPAELIDGEIVPMTGTNLGSGDAAFFIRTSLYQYSRANGGGRGISESVTFVVQTPRTQAFVPDVSWYVGEGRRERFVYGAPALAVEIRSTGDYGPSAEREMKRKRGLYFAAGTQVVWDVDVLRENLIRVYRADDPEHATVYRQGEIAEAEPAVPGWRFPVDELFQE